MNPPVRLALLGLAWVMVGLATAGIFLPLLPTTPFLLIAVWLFSRSSPRLEQWLTSHAVFGPPLRDWREHGAIARRTKILAISLMALGLAYLWLAIEPPVIGLLAVAAIMMACGTFIALRPEPPAEK